MKERLLAALLILSFTKCVWDPPMSGSDGYWSIVNKTELVLVVEYGGNITMMIPPTEWRPLKSSSVPPSDFAEFELIWNEYPESQRKCVIYAEDGTLLKEWILDNSTSEPHHFFDESSWVRTQEATEFRKEVMWQFEILPEDIQ